MWNIKTSTESGRNPGPLFYFLVSWEEGESLLSLSKSKYIFVCSWETLCIIHFINSVCLVSPLSGLSILNGEIDPGKPFFFVYRHSVGIAHNSQYWQISMSIEKLFNSKIEFTIFQLTRLSADSMLGELWVKGEHGTCLLSLTVSGKAYCRNGK